MKEFKPKVQWRAVLLGTCAGAVAMICLCAAAAGLMAKGAVGLDRMGLFAAGILVASSLLGGLTALLGGGGPVDAALTAAGELVVLTALNAGLNGGKMEGIAVTILALAGGCGAALLLRIGKGSRRSRGRRRRKNR